MTTGQVFLYIALFILVVIAGTSVVRGLRELWALRPRRNRRTEKE